MTTTADIGIPLVAQQQTQPEVTHNEALLMLSALAGGVIQVGLNAPPGSPTIGDAYVIGAAPTGAWAGRANAVVVRVSGGWRFIPDKDSGGSPIAMGARQEGMRVYDQNTNSVYVWDGAAWSALASLPYVPLDYGQRAISNNAVATAKTAAVDPTLATNTDYTQITGIWNATPDGQNSGITQQANSFTIALSGVYRVEFWANVKSDTNNTQVGFKFAVNGVISLVRRPKIFMRNIGEVHNGAAFGYAYFNAGDIVTLWIASTQTANITIEDCVFGATAVKYF